MIPTALENNQRHVFFGLDNCSRACSAIQLLSGCPRAKALRGMITVCRWWPRHTGFRRASCCATGDGECSGAVRLLEVDILLHHRRHLDSLLTRELSSVCLSSLAACHHPTTIVVLQRVCPSFVRWREGDKIVSRAHQGRTPEPVKGANTDHVKLDYHWRVPGTWKRRCSRHSVPLAHILNFSLCVLG